MPGNRFGRFLVGSNRLEVLVLNRVGVRVPPRAPSENTQETAIVSNNRKQRNGRYFRGCFHQAGSGLTHRTPATRAVWVMFHVTDATR